MKTRLLLIIMVLLSIGFTGIAFAMHDPDQPQTHSIILPPDMKEKTFDEFMEWCVPYYGEKCIELEKKRTPIILSPLKQFKSGIPIDEIQCKNHKHVLTERHNGKPACVYYLTAEKLNWNILRADSTMTPTIFEVLKNEEIFDVEYYIKGGTIQDMIYDVDTNVLLVTVDATNKGSMTIHMPRSLIDAKMDYCPPRNVNAFDDPFFVLINGEEVSYDEISTTSKKRTLQIPFIEGVSDIEIIGACLI